jgi:hypothetical protein
MRPLTIDTMTRRTRLTRREASTYLELRNAGRAASSAFYVIDTMRAASAVLELSSDYADAPYGDYGLLEAYTIDPAALEVQTSVTKWSTVFDATTGAPIVHPVILPPGATARAYVYRDDDHESPADELESEGGCYTVADVEAWRADLWQYVGVAVVVTLANGDTGQAALWGTEQGDYWPGSDESDIWHTIADVTSEAIADALATTRNVSTAVSEALL